MTAKAAALGEKPPEGDSEGLKSGRLSALFTARGGALRG